jgi:hypothetical protein
MSETLEAVAVAAHVARPGDDPMTTYMRVAYWALVRFYGAAQRANASADVIARACMRFAWLGTLTVTNQIDFNTGCRWLADTAEAIRAKQQEREQRRVTAIRLDPYSDPFITHRLTRLRALRWERWERAKAGPGAPP